MLYGQAGLRIHGGSNRSGRQRRPESAGPFCPTWPTRTRPFCESAFSGFTRSMKLLHSHELADEWTTASRWAGVTRPYTPEDVCRLRGTIRIEYTLARMVAERLWKLLNEEPYVPALGALTGGHAGQQVEAGLKAICLSGWQVAAGPDLDGEMYPVQSLYPGSSVPAV